MKLYDGGRAPNPRRLRVFLAEKSIAVDMIPIDIGKSEMKSAQITALNPYQRLPILQLDDGQVICESIAICRYFEEVKPDPPLFGRDMLERARVEMWNRRAELHLFNFVAAAFRHIHPAMRELEKPQIPEWGLVCKDKVIAEMTRLDCHFSDNQYLAGDYFSVADITALCAIDFCKPARILLPEALAHLRRWHQAVSGRPSAAA